MKIAFSARILDHKNLFKVILKTFVLKNAVKMDFLTLLSLLIGVCVHTIIIFGQDGGSRTCRCHDEARKKQK